MSATDPDPSQPQPASADPGASMSLYEQERRAKRDKLRELGVDPYGGRVEGLTPLATAKAAYAPEMGADAGPVMKVAGRVMLKRDMGKLSFMTLRDETGDLQVGIDKKRVDEKSWGVNNLIDLGDQVVAEGPIGVTKKGETTVWATSLSMAAKSLLPPPSKWEGLSDVELRYRQRYVDLWANPEVMKVAKQRIAIVDEIRRYMRERGFLEVETPMMQPIHGGAAARPFETHHKALDMKLFLRIAPELYLKRLLVGGFGKVFEINRNFRNEGISPRHNPEFTMLEAYEAFGSWETMADLVEGMICHVAEKVLGTLKIVHRRDAEGAEKTINLTRPWRRVRMVELVEERTGWKFDKRSILEAAPVVYARIITDRFMTHGEQWARQAIAAARDLMQQAKEDPEVQYALARSILADIQADTSSDAVSAYIHLLRQAYATDSRLDRMIELIKAHPLLMDLIVHHDPLRKLSPAEQLVEVYEKLIEPTLIDPCFVTHVPSVVIPLARKNRDDPFFADVYELAINGQEISPGYSELNDPDVQAANFQHQVGDKEEQQKTDEDFLAALRYGMPPAGGMGLGIDRLIMMLTGAESIRDVILFPLMRPTE